MSGPEIEGAATSESTTTSRAKRLLRKAVKCLGLTALLAIALVLAHRPLLVGFAHLLRVNNPAPANAIVLLLGGRSHRAQTAAALYKQGLAPVIWLCRERVDPLDAAEECDLIKRYLVRRLGVPAENVVILPGEVTSTREEAQRVNEYLDTHPAHRLIVVTTSFHTRRARWIFDRVLASRGVDVRVAAATDPKFDESNWYQNEDGLVTYFTEAIKTVFYRLKY